MKDDRAIEQLGSHDVARTRKALDRATDSRAVQSARDPRRSLVDGQSSGRGHDRLGTSGGRAGVRSRLYGTLDRTADRPCHGPPVIIPRGAQTTVSSAVGMALAFVIIQVLGINIWTFALALLIGLLGARLSWIRDEGVAIATTAIFIFTSQDPMFLDRTMELLLGVAVGIVVNLLVVPPLRDRQAARYVDSINRRMGDVLKDMSEELAESWDTDRADAWKAETDSMSEELNSAWQTVKLARESQRENPRSIMMRRKPDDPDEVSYEEILGRVDEGISHLRNLTRTLRDAPYDVGSWDEQFRQQWIAIVHDAGVAIAAPEQEVQPLLDRLLQLSSDMSTAENLPHIQWPTYGALISSLRHILTIVDDVASAQEVRES